MKKILKFQLKDILIGCAVYALVMFLLTFILIGIISIVLTSEDVRISLNGNGFASAIFCLAMGIGIYKEHCQMAVTNSVSRKDFFKSLVCVTMITGLLCTLIDQILHVINHLPGLNPASNPGFTNNFDLLKILQMFYPGFFETHSAAMIAATSFLLEFLVNSVLFTIGTLIAGISLRIPKKFRTAYCIALPVFGCGVFPMLSVAAWLHPQSVGWVSNVCLNIMGISSGNPFLGALTFTAAIVIMACICYRVLRRTDIV
ncbi:MAG: hypothetical protein K1W22_00630 [Lachnospiraceae bacterium]